LKYEVYYWINKANIEIEICDLVMWGNVKLEGIKLRFIIFVNKLPEFLILKEEIKLLYEYKFI
jgi:hypothetical protein